MIGRPGTVSATLPSLGNMTANLSTTTVDSSLSVFSNETSATGRAARNVTITALNTGVLTVSIPFQVHNQGPISGDWSSFTSATVQFVAGGRTISFADGSTLSILMIAWVPPVKRRLASPRSPYR